MRNPKYFYASLRISAQLNKYLRTHINIFPGNKIFLRTVQMFSRKKYNICGIFTQINRHMWCPPLHTKKISDLEVADYFLRLGYNISTVFSKFFFSLLRLIYNIDLLRLQHSTTPLNISFFSLFTCFVVLRQGWLIMPVTRCQ